MTTGYYDALGNRTSKTSSADIGAGIVNLSAILAIPLLVLYFLSRGKRPEAKPNVALAPDPALLEEIQSALNAVGLDAQGNIVGPPGTPADLKRLEQLIVRLRQANLPVSANELAELAELTRERQKGSS